MSTTSIDHPVLHRVKEAFPEGAFSASLFRGQVTLVLEPEVAHDVLRFLREDPDCSYELLSDVTAADYLDYPARTSKRFAVVWVLRSFSRDDLLLVKTWLDPSMETGGNEEDPALEDAGHRWLSHRRSEHYRAGRSGFLGCRSPRHRPHR